MLPFPSLFFFMILTNVQVLMEIHTRKSTSVQDDGEEQLCGAL